MEKNEAQEFVVYFEIFGIKKKCIVKNHEINSQKEAQDYVLSRVIIHNTKFYDPSSVKKDEIPRKEISDLDDTFNKLKDFAEDIFGKDFFKKNKI